MPTIQERVSKIVGAQLAIPLADVKSESKFVGDLGADSLDHVELIMTIEDEFGIEIPDAEANKLTTVGEAIAYLEKTCVAA